jgi:hypothetical protein
MKYPGGLRESNLGWMARRERRAYPQWSVRSEQRRQTAQIAFALRVAPLLILARVAPQSQTAAGMLLRRALAKIKIDQQRGPPGYFNSLLCVSASRPSLFRSKRAQRVRLLSASK